MSSTQNTNFVQSGQRTVRMEREAVASLEARIDDHFCRACELLMQTRGRVILTGMGKSGHIASKIAATLASTGTPSFFVHPGEASHGDMGMITDGDAVLALSNSGSTPEIMTLLPLLKRLGSVLVSMTGNPESALASASDAHLNIGVETEACPLDLAPTSSTTNTLVMGDALAIALLEARGTDWFRERYPEVFASKHWARGEEVVAVFGWPGVAGLSAMPFPLHPLVVLGVLAGMKKRALLSALFLGRFTKYLAFGWVATNSPGALRRLRGGGEKRT